MLKMLIADDEPVIIRGLQMLIDWAQLGIEICATCENGADALREIFAQSPDLALLDISMPGKTGIVSIDFITGLTFTDELKDLYATLQTNGIDVYIVSASPIDTVLAANETMGYNLPEDHVYAMRNKLGEDGRYINEYNYDWGGEGKYAQTQGEGKSTIITNFIAPQYDNAGPLMVFGDSSGDWNMMTDWMESGDTELGVIFNRYRKPGSDPIWEGSTEAAQSIGDSDARFVLQGRDENTGELRPSEKSILLGETDEVLVRPAE